MHGGREPMMEERTAPAVPVERPLTGAAGGSGETAHAGAPHLADPRALVILTTEHWSLLSQRNLAWTESFSRASMFLATLSAAVVALALVGSVMRDGFIVFALVILPVVWFIGETTAVRLSQSNADDGRAVQGMNRIRHAYLEVNPRLAPYFITGSTDDPSGIERTIGVHRPGSVFAHWIVTMPGMVAVIDGVLAGLIVGLAVNTVAHMAMTEAIAAGAVVGVIVPVVLAVRSRRSMSWLMRAYRPKFRSGETTLYGWDEPDADSTQDGSRQPGA
jgi:hypothetical protein